MIGGDHSLLWPGAAGVADVYGPGSVGVIHFDAHADAGHNMLGHLASHGTPIRRLIADDGFPGRNFIQVGLRGYYPDDETFEWMRSVGMRSHYMAEVERKGWDPVLDRALKEALDGPRYLYISLDVDVMDPAYTPGTGTPGPGGLTPRELFPLLRRLTAENRVVGIDVVEMNPLVDPGYTTALNVNRCIREMLVGLGAPEAGHHHPELPRPAGRRGGAGPRRRARAPEAPLVSLGPARAPRPPRLKFPGRHRRPGMGELEDHDAPDPYPAPALADRRPGALGGGLARPAGPRRRGPASRRPGRRPARGTATARLAPSGRPWSPRA